jgi:hypothetical protein
MLLVVALVGCSIVGMLDMPVLAEAPLGFPEDKAVTEGMVVEQQGQGYPTLVQVVAVVPEFSPDPLMAVQEVLVSLS